MSENKAPKPLDINLSFQPDLHGVAHIPGKPDLPVLKDGYAPYEMLISALGACFFHTFREIVEKMKLQFDHLELQIHGERKADPPQTLVRVQMDAQIFGAQGEHEKFDRAFELAEKYCSVHETVARVATIDSQLTYQDR